MAWYDKYLIAFERPYSTVPQTVKQEVADKLEKLSLQAEDPLVSVVLIAHNEERHILSCLWSLVNNICDFPIEIIVVSNCSTDATESILDELGAYWFQELKKGPGFARQCGLNHARGMYHVCIDVDTLYPPLYIATHVSYLKKKDIVCTYGFWSFLPDEHHSKLGLFFYEFLRDIYLSLQNISRPELCVRGMTLAFRTEYGKQVGYKTNIIRGEDGMMALGLKKYGKLKLLHTRKARAMTCSSTLDGGGGLLQNLWSRCVTAIKRTRLLFSSQTEYKDQDYNLIKKDDER